MRACWLFQNNFYIDCIDIIKKWVESVGIQIDTDSQARSSLEFPDIMEIWICEIESFNTKNVSNRESWLKES